MHEEHLRLHGKTYDYKVLYKHIHRQFLLPRADQMYQQLIVSISFARAGSVGSMDRTYVLILDT
jgi:hypothetical protein